MKKEKKPNIVLDLIMDKVKREVHPMLNMILRMGVATYFLFFIWSIISAIFYVMYVFLYPVMVALGWVNNE